MINHLINQIKQDKYIPSVIKDHFGGFPGVGVNILRGNSTDKHDRFPGYMIYNRKEYPTEWNHVLVVYDNIYVHDELIQTGSISTHEHPIDRCDCMYYDQDYFERYEHEADFMYNYHDYYDHYEFNTPIINIKFD